MNNKIKYVVFIFNVIFNIIIKIKYNIIIILKEKYLKI